MQALILAGGLGTRLKTVVADKPKALSPIGNKPFLYYVIDYLQKKGITHITFSLGYLAEQIVNYLQINHSNLQYNYYIEEKPLGTGGAIKKCINLISANDFLIVNADTFFDVPLQQMFQFHSKNNNDCTIALKQMKNFDRYGTVEVDNESNIISFKEKQPKQEGLINGGFVFLNKDCFIQHTKNLNEVFSFEKDFLEKNLHQIKIKGFIGNGYFIDIGIPEDYLIAQNVFTN